MKMKSKSQKGETNSNDERAEKYSQVVERGSVGTVNDMRSGISKLNALDDENDL